VSGLVTAESDLDVLVVIKTKTHFFQRFKELPKLFSYLDQLPIDVDVLIYTPEEFAALLKEGMDSKVGFWANFYKHHLKISLD
jgi:predicted nucleotidyltransferase